VSDRPDSCVVSGCRHPNPATGHYEITGLAPGSYTLLFIDARGANVGEFYDDTPDPTFADPVGVTAGATTVADAALDP